MTARNADEIEISAVERIGGEGGRGYPSQDPSSASTEEKIRIVLEGLRGEESIASLCRRGGIADSLYYSWPKSFWTQARALR